MNKKKILLVIVVLAIILVIVGYNMYNKDHVDVISTIAFEEVSAIQLIDYFNEDEEGATSKYIDQVLQVEGTILNIEINNNVTTIFLESDDMMKSVSCEMDGTIKDGVEIGSIVRIKGICAGSLMDVVLVQCKLI